MKNYDIVIIGSGAGLSFVNIALKNGLTCALIENTKFGGTCLTRGCIPSKILVYPADVIRQSQHVKKIGLDFAPPVISWDTIAKRMWSEIDQSKDIENGMADIENLTIYKGTGEFTGEYTMKVKMKNGDYSEEFSGEKFIIAAGGRSFIPPIDGLSEAGYITSENFFGDAFPKNPWKSLVIVGGGAIGGEFAHIFSALGTNVTVVEMQNHLVSTEEEEISIHLEKQFADNGIDVRLNHKVTAVKKTLKGKIVTVEDVVTGDKKNIKCQEIFISSGIRSNTDILKIENTAVEVDRKGWIVTNEHLETSQKNIWAIGDINGKYQFRHKANYETKICINNVFNADKHGHKHKLSADYSKIPWAIFTYPQIAHVGMTERQALDKGYRILVGRNNYSSVAKGFAMGYSPGDSDDGFVKLIVDENMLILGVHIIGPYAAILIQSFVYLMNAGFTCTMYDKDGESYRYDHEGFCIEAGTFEPMVNSIVIHPSLSEVTGWIIGKLDWVN